MSVVLKAKRLVDAFSDIDHAWVLINGNVIEAVGQGQTPDDTPVIDLGDATLVPGFIDLHSHGGAGFSFDTAEEAGISRALKMHRLHGTTRSVLSFVAAPIADLKQSLGVVARAMDADPLILGAHLEGPFLSPLAAGAHAPSHLRAPRGEDVRALLDAAPGVLRQITIAPELPGALDAIETFVHAGVVAAVGHTGASFEQATAAFDAGARILTHAFNAMPGIHHRRPGPIAAAVERDDVTLELILDGHHVAPAAAKVLLRSAVGRVAFVSDSMAAAGVGDGKYQLGPLPVTVEHGVARLSGTETIAGSTLTLDKALTYSHRVLGSSLQDAVAAVTLVPARALDLATSLGRLAPGFAADVVVLDSKLTVQQVWADGRQISGRASSPASGLDERHEKEIGGYDQPPL